MPITPQKRRANPYRGSIRRSGPRLVGIFSIAMGIGVIGYLVSQEYDGILTAALASALASMVAIARGR